MVFSWPMWNEDPASRQESKEMDFNSLFGSPGHGDGIYNLLLGACACAFLRMGSNLVASVLTSVLPAHRVPDNARQTYS